MPKKPQRIAAKYAGRSKVKKARRKATPPPPGQKPSLATPLPARPSPLTTAVPRPAPSRQAGAAEYRYVISDLKNIALLSGAMLLLLFLLAFLIK